LVNAVIPPVTVDTGAAVEEERLVGVGGGSDTKKDRIVFDVGILVVWVNLDAHVIFDLA
jgi:hypothetical protein